LYRLKIIQNNLDPDNKVHNIGTLLNYFLEGDLVRS
jgi:hypothetical protein